MKNFKTWTWRKDGDYPWEVHGCVITVRFRSGIITDDWTSSFNWKQDGGLNDIEAYKVLEKEKS